MRTKRMLQQRKLRFEGLEQRTLLAVTASLSGTELRVTGDNADNHIDIFQTGAGEFDVIDGDTALPIGAGSFTGVASIRVELKGGSDALHITGDNLNPLTGDVNIKAGLGGDDVRLGADMAGPTTALDVSGNVNIETSDGDDVVEIAPGTNIGGNLTVNTGHQNDDLIVAGSPADPIEVGGNVTLKTSEGDDGDVLFGTGGVSLGDIGVTGNTVIETSDGDDVVNVGGLSVFLGRFSVNSGHGDDFVQVGDGLNGIEIGGPLDLNTSVGDDTLIVQLNNFAIVPATTIKTSDGEDIVTIRDSVFASLDVNTGLHDDLLIFDGLVTVFGDATLNGSGGAGDTLDLFGLAFFGSLDIKGFEIFI